MRAGVRNEMPADGEGERDTVDDDVEDEEEEEDVVRDDDDVMDDDAVDRADAPTDRDG